MFVTWDVSQPLSSPLKDEADAKADFIFTTEDVSHFDISPLKVSLDAKIFSKFVTFLRFQSEITPYFFVANPYNEHRPSVGASVKQASTAAVMVKSVRQ